MRPHYSRPSIQHKPCKITKAPINSEALFRKNMPEDFPAVQKPQTTQEEEKEEEEEYYEATYSSNSSEQWVNDDT